MSERSRSINVSFRATQEERDMIAAKMKRAGMRNLRAYLLKMAVEGQVIRLDLSAVSEMVFLLRNATNNLNQIARRVNETRSIYEADIQDLQAHYDKLWEQVGVILKKLSKL